MLYVFDLYETFVHHQHLLVSKDICISFYFKKIEFITSVLSIEVNDDRDSKLNSSRTVLYVAFIFSPHCY